MDFQRALLLERRGDKGNAKAYFAEAHELLPGYGHPAVHLAGLDTPAEAIAVLEPLIGKTDDPQIDAAYADALRRVGRNDDANTALARAKARYEALVQKHELAFADHAAQFYLGLGQDPQRALSLARVNAKNRPTEPALDLWITAALAAGARDEACTAAAQGAALRYSTPAFKAMLATTRSGCDGKSPGTSAANAPLNVARLWAASVGLAILFLVGSASAHSTGVSRGEYRAAAGVVHALYVFSGRELATTFPALDANHDGELSAAEVSADARPLDAAIVEASDIEADGVACAPSFESAKLAEADAIEIRASFACGRAIGHLSIDCQFLERFSADHHHLAVVDFADHETPFVATLSQKTIEADLASSGAAATTFPRMVLTGVEHILTGYDHLAFLVGLLLLGGRVRSLVGIITAFTIAHSITLGLAALRVVSLSPSFVEPAIALSIAYVRSGEPLRSRRLEALADYVPVWPLARFWFRRGAHEPRAPSREAPRRALRVQPRRRAWPARRPGHRLAARHARAEERVVSRARGEGAKRDDRDRGRRLVRAAGLGVSLTACYADPRGSRGRGVQDGANARALLPRVERGERATPLDLRRDGRSTSAPQERVMSVLAAHGLLAADGRLHDDVSLYSMGDHFDWGGLAEADAAREDGLALLAWLASHPADHVHLLAGNHDLARVGELVGFDDASFREAQALAVPIYIAKDRAAEERFTARFAALPGAEIAARDFASFSSAQKALVERVLRAKRFRLAYALGAEVLLTHAGITAPRSWSRLASIRRETRPRSEPR